MRVLFPSTSGLSWSCLQSLRVEFLRFFATSYILKLNGYKFDHQIVLTLICSLVSASSALWLSPLSSPLRLTSIAYLCSSPLYSSIALVISSLIWSLTSSPIFCFSRSRNVNFLLNYFKIQIISKSSIQPTNRRKLQSSCTWTGINFGTNWINRYLRLQELLLSCKLLKHLFC